MKKPAAAMKKPAAAMKKPAAAKNGIVTKSFDRTAQYVGPKGGIWTLVGWRELCHLTTPPPSTDQRRAQVGPTDM
jgi:hypothetical protein